MFINLSPHPRRRLKTRMSPLVSSGLVVQWFLFRGPVATASILPLSPEVRQWSGCLLDSTHPLDVGWYHEPSVHWTGAHCSLSKNLVLFLSLLLCGLSGSKWDFTLGSFKCLSLLWSCVFTLGGICGFRGWGHLPATPPIPSVSKHRRRCRKGTAQLWYRVLQLLCWQFRRIHAPNHQAASSSCS